MSYQDKTLTCVDCGAPFAFTANEQAFYADRGFTNEPKRCPTCRQSRKSQRNSYGSDGATSSYGGGSYSAGSYGGGGGASATAGGGGGGGRSGGGFGGQREMHTVTCDGCGGEAKVPFVPRGDRPVYCSDCYGKQRAGGPGGTGGGYSRAGGGGRY
jgi:CxxC-x17-CxxC domain-containing protein